LVVITIAAPEADAPACAPVLLLLLPPLLPHAAAVSATAISAPNRTGTGMRVNNDLLIVIVSRLAQRWPLRQRRSLQLLSRVVIRSPTSSGLGRRYVMYVTKQRLRSAEGPIPGDLRERRQFLIRGQPVSRRQRKSSR
jgi:hypothetical protein